MRALLAVVMLVSTVSAAESSWLAAHGRVDSDARASVWGGTRSVGLGVAVPDANGARAALTGEAQYAFFDRVVELRGARLWQLTAPRLVTLSAAVSGAVFLVPEGQVDIGAGPHASLTASIGGPRFSVDLSVQSGVELFARGPTRLPERLSLGVSFTVGPLAFTVAGRAGLDLVPAGAFVFRGEAVACIGWAYNRSLEHVLR